MFRNTNFEILIEKRVDCYRFMLLKLQKPLSEAKFSWSPS